MIGSIHINVEHSYTSGGYGRLAFSPFPSAYREGHDMTDNAARNKKVIVEVLTDAYTKRDFAKLEKWFAPAYVQHNPFIPAGRDGLPVTLKSCRSNGATRQGSR